ncbi:hypothetical protein ASE73_10490 [Sphingomonas sp. Leaf24]|uniref:DUF6456 domain-containing protein n=1 Tax=unclassified Sphingomonas TaxID=196159 RepID=UPI0006F88E9C|nr:MULTISPECIES: DUF6456 domain-containing protein [unclassified Sphingomonas]KQM14573.1 hypothetical protein ASE50_08540 [Sphingomonas sp. Leaf5]KQM87874.1 hypothetical protein ASE73_10490 [Sphingomonas sp. Leaf24]
MRELVERRLEAGRIRDVAGGRRVTVNLRESPLDWLKARSLVDGRQFEAGERLRGDFERASLGPQVTMRWDGAPRGSNGAPVDPSGRQVAARARFDAAITAVGPGLSDILWRTVCANEGLPAAEKALGWPARAGRLVLTLALDRLAAHYRF